MATLSEIMDLLARDGQRHSFSKVCGFGGLLIIGATVPTVLIRGGHFQLWDCAALALPALIPHCYGLLKTYLSLRFEKPVQ